MNAEPRKTRAASSKNSDVRNFIAGLRRRLASAKHSESVGYGASGSITEPEALARAAEPRAQRCGEAEAGREIERTARCAHPFLASASGSVGNGADPVRQVGPGDDLAALFQKNAVAAGFQVHPATAADWRNVIHGILKSHAARSVWLGAPEPPVLSATRCADLIAGLQQGGVQVRREHDDETMFSADAAITGVSAAIAETGTIVCESGTEHLRGSSLIPPVHIAVVAVSQIVPDLCDFFEECGRRAALPANINLITGPSKTADVEGVLVTGVHGPGHVHLVVFAEQ